MVVGFAAETDDVLANGRAKLARKGCDLLVVNEVGERKTFGSEENEAVVLGADGSETPVPHGPKEALADIVWDLVADRLAVTRRPTGHGDLTPSRSLVLRGVVAAGRTDPLGDSTECPCRRSHCFREARRSGRCTRRDR